MLQYDLLVLTKSSVSLRYAITFGERSIAGGGDTSDNAAQLLLDYTCSEIPKKLVEDKT